MRSLCGVLAVASALPGAQADWLSDLLGSALGSFGSGSGSGSDDVSLDVSVVAESDTDLNFTAAATLHAGDVDLNVTVAFAAEKCDTRNLQATVEVDMITPDVFSQGMCRLLGMGCGSSYIVTSLFEQTYAIAPPAHNVSMTVDDPLEFEVNLTPWDEDTPVSIVFSNVLPMFTGLSFTVEAHGLSTGVIRTSLSDCAMLDDVMSGLGITEADLGLDEGALCAFLGDSIDVTNDLLEELGLTTDPINVGKLIADRVDEPLAWLDEDTGTVTLGQNSDVCQITPDPFRVVFEDVGGNALDSLLANAETIVNAFVETANRCLGGGNTYEYTITAANFADISFEQDENGQWVLSGSLFGGAAKNPAGIFRFVCFCSMIFTAVVCCVPVSMPPTIQTRKLTSGSSAFPCRRGLSANAPQKVALRATLGRLKWTTGRKLHQGTWKLSPLTTSATRTPNFLSVTALRHLRHRRCKLSRPRNLAWTATLLPLWLLSASRL